MFAERGARAERGGADGSRDERERRYGHRGRAGARYEWRHATWRVRHKKTGQQGAEKSSREIWKNLVDTEVRCAKRGGPFDGRGVVVIEQKEKRSTPRLQPPRVACHARERLYHPREQPVHLEHDA